jgi:sensor domain CHASE-containing protein
MDEKAMTTVELVKEITHQVGELARKQVDLAKTELRTDLRREVATVAGLAVAIAGAIVTVALLMVTVALALSRAMPAWAAGLLVTAFMLGITVIAGLVTWHHRVRVPLERTRQTLKDDVGFTREKLA